MKVLLACEESQSCTIEFRKLGHEAYSCDLEDCSGGHPEWHLKQDVIPLLIEDWDLIVAFPPCTHISNAGAKWFEQKKKDGRQQEGIDYFLQFTNLKCARVAIENPVGIMSRIYRKPDQIVQPYWFGDPFTKTTCLWLKGLSLLKPTNMVGKGERHITKGGKSLPVWYNLPPSVDRGKIRSKTFSGLAKAIAEQWSI